MSHHLTPYFTTKYHVSESADEDKRNQNEKEEDGMRKNDEKKKLDSRLT